MEIHLCWVTPESLKGVDWLTAHEAQALHKIKAATYREDWLAGRLAAKKLIQQYLLARAGHKVALPQIEIMNYESGAPYARVQTLSFELSLAHSAGHGLAGLSPHGPMGVDLQQIRPVRSDLGERVLSERERPQLARFWNRSEGLLVFWALKEAAIKARRTLPAPALREIAVELTSPGHAEVVLPDRTLRAAWGRWKEFIWAWTLNCGARPR
jgi:phosphopantetheinyl transferase